MSFSVSELTWRQLSSAPEHKKKLEAKVSTSTLATRKVPGLRRAAHDALSAPAVAPQSAGEAAIAPVSSASAARAVDLRPLQVARSLLSSEPDAPAEASVPSTTASSAGAATNESVAASLHAKFAPRVGDTPKLAKRPDGSYSFQGNGFNAIVRKDGSLLMRDRYGEFYPPFYPVQRADGSWFMAIIGGNFDLMAYIDHLVGNDPYRSERTWFLTHTRALREQLAQKSADQAVQMRLRRIWSDAGLTFAERKRKTFMLWDDCTEDVPGAHGRAVIESFVRENCPQRDVRGFSPDELDELNKRRRSRIPFEPYTEQTSSP